MIPIRIFISSVQSEFAIERRKLCDYIRNDALFRRYFIPFIFEDLPAKDMSAQEAYLDEVKQSDIYIGLFGSQYGYEDNDGISPTEREFDMASTNHLYRLIFIKSCQYVHPKEAKLIKKAETQVVRDSFSDYEELQAAIYSALVHYLSEKDILRFLPWDATICPFATINDIDFKRVETWVDMAVQKRGYPIPYSEKNVPRILHHLHLMTEKGELRNAALLLFAKDPQAFFTESQIKCMVFPTKIKTKPILSYHVYGGTIFDLIDSAVAFVMQHIDAKVNPRTQTTDANVEYEIPYSAVAESITNAVVHRSYESNGSVQVMLFPDRLEIWNPGRLPFGLTPEKLAEEHESKPVNPILAEPVYMTGYIERAGTGTTDVINTCLSLGLPQPDYRQEEDFKLTIWRRNSSSNDPQSEHPHFNDIQDIRTNSDPQNDPQNDPQKLIGEKVLNRQRKLFETILVNRQMSKEDIAALLKVSQETIKRDLRSLRHSYDIDWIGATKTGHWVIKTKQ